MISFYEHYGQLRERIHKMPDGVDKTTCLDLLEKPWEAEKLVAKASDVRGIKFSLMDSTIILNDAGIKRLIVSHLTVRRDAIFADVALQIEGILGTPKDGEFTQVQPSNGRLALNTRTNKSQYFSRHESLPKGWRWF